LADILWDFEDYVATDTFDASKYQDLDWLILSTSKAMALAVQNIRKRQMISKTPATPASKQSPQEEGTAIMRNTSLESSLSLLSNPAEQSLASGLPPTLQSPDLQSLSGQPVSMYVLLPSGLIIHVLTLYVPEDYPTSSRCSESKALPYSRMHRP
jgi:hypothetical protein